MQTVYKCRRCSTSEQEQSLLFVMEVCRLGLQLFSIYLEQRCQNTEQIRITSNIAVTEKESAQSEKSQLKNPSDGIIHAGG